MFVPAPAPAPAAAAALDEEWDANLCNLYRNNDRCVTIHRDDKAKGCFHTDVGDDGDDDAEEKEQDTHKTTSKLSKLDDVLVCTSVDTALGLVR